MLEQPNSDQLNDIEKGDYPDTDKRLEAVSEKIRSGIPVGFAEALEAIDYQQKLKADRDAARSKTLLGRFMRWIRGA